MVFGSFMITICMAWHRIGGICKGIWPVALLEWGFI